MKKSGHQQILKTLTTRTTPITIIQTSRTQAKQSETHSMNRTYIATIMTAS